MQLQTNVSVSTSTIQISIARKWTPACFSRHCRIPKLIRIRSKRTSIETRFTLWSRTTRCLTPFYKSLRKILKHHSFQLKHLQMKHRLEMAVCRHNNLPHLQRRDTNTKWAKWRTWSTKLQDSNSTKNVISFISSWKTRKWSRRAWKPQRNW